MKIKYLFELGGENTELGKYEALELLKTENYAPEIILDNKNIVVIEVSNELKVSLSTSSRKQSSFAPIVHNVKESDVDCEYTE